MALSQSTQKGCVMAKMTNRHPVDRLHDVREQIKALKEEEAALRATIIAARDFQGAEHLASLSVQTVTRMDRAALERAFGKDAVAKHCKPRKIEMLKLRKRAGVFG